MGPDKLPANAHSRNWNRGLLLTVGLIKSARRAIKGASLGEVVRTRTVVLQAHTHQFLGTFGGSGNGDYRGELQRSIGVITNYATQFGLSTASLLVRLDGLYGDAAPLLDVLSADLAVIARSRAYHLLDLDVVQQVLAHAPAETQPPPGKWDAPSTLRLPSGSLDASWTRGAPGGSYPPRHLLALHRWG